MSYNTQTTDVTVMSSKGQIVLPKSIRTQMSIDAGTNFVVFCDGSNILLKPITKPSLEEFNSLVLKASKWANDVGLTEDDISEAISTVRKNKAN